MGNKKTKTKLSSNGNRSRNGGAIRKNHVAEDVFVHPPSQKTKSQNSTNGDIRTYSIPDYRLEHPNFTVRQRIETDRHGAEHVH